MKIKRTTANKIMTRAINTTDTCLMAVMDPDERILCADSEEEIIRLMQEHPRATLIYNQSPEARKIKNSLQFADGQQCIEVFQDTEGVFGLRAYLQIGKIQTPVILELSDD